MIPLVRLLLVSSFFASTMWTSASEPDLSHCEGPLCALSSLAGLPLVDLNAFVVEARPSLGATQHHQDQGYELFGADHLAALYPQLSFELGPNESEFGAESYNSSIRAPPSPTHSMKEERQSRSAGLSYVEHEHEIEFETRFSADSSAVLGQETLTSRPLNPVSKEAQELLARQCAAWW